MRILRLRLANYRAIEACEVRFAASGVTIVEGPNEAGKSSLAEAIDFVLRFLDSSRDQELLATRPKGKDVATEVEIEIEAGAYHFVLSKRFHKDKRTELVLLRPASERLSGREAHERARAILSETIDWQLWQALRIGQGEGLSPPDWSKQVQLSACLDRAAGTVRSGGAAESLFEAVQAEVRRYYTDKTGQPKKGTADAPLLLELEATAEAAELEVVELERRLAEIDQDVASCARLDREVRELAARVPALREAARSHDESLRRVEELSSERDRLAREVVAAENRLELALKVRAERRALAASAASLAADHAAGLAELELARSRAAEAEAAAAHAASLEEEARSLAAATRERLALARADLQRHEEEGELERLRERRDRARAADQALREAQTVVSSSRIDAAAFAKIEELQRAVEKLELLLEADAPAVSITALAAAKLAVDGHAIELARGASHEVRLSERRTIDLPGSLRLELAPGRGTRELDRERGERVLELARACEAAGAASRDDAQRALEARRAAERAAAEHRRALATELGRETLGEIEASLAALEKVAGERAAERARRAEPPPADRATARRALLLAERAEEEARESFLGAQRSGEASRLEHERAREAARFAERRTADLERSLDGARAALEDAAALAAEDAIEARVREAERELGAAEAAARRTGARLEAEDGEGVRARAENARAAVARAESERRAAEQERLTLAVRLATLGDEGLGERLFEAQVRRLRARGELERLARRARAAKVLHTALRERRDAARAAYVAPLREKIERLGRWMGRDFAVELDESLAIASRTLAGVTIPYDELSAGAREQLCLIARLASAMIVGEADGVPVILDDALGHTDSARLDEMSALLALAARSSQVILLSCAPERFRGLAAAERIRLPR